jgi:hypothetical protein
MDVEFDIAVSEEEEVLKSIFPTQLRVENNDIIIRFGEPDVAGEIFFRVRRNPRYPQEQCDLQLTGDISETHIDRVLRSMVQQPLLGKPFVYELLLQVQSALAVGLPYHLSHVRASVSGLHATQSRLNVATRNGGCCVLTCFQRRVVNKGNHIASVHCY